MMQSFGQTLAYINNAGTLYNTYTTAKSVLTSATTVAGVSSGAVVLPPGFFRQGTKLVIEATFGVSWASGNTMTFEVRLGPTSTIVAFTGGAMKVTTTGGTTIPMSLYIDLTCRSEGTGTLATLIGLGRAMGRMCVPAAATAGADYSAGSGVAMLPDSAPSAGTGFDSTVANTLDLFCAMGTSSASNGIQVQQYHVWSPNLAGA